MLGCEGMRGVYLLIWQLLLLNMWSWVTVPEPPKILVINTDLWDPLQIH